MTNTTTPSEKALEVLVEGVADVKQLVRDQREIADSQHLTALRLDHLGDKLKHDVKLLKAEIKAASSEA